MEPQMNWSTSWNTSAPQAPVAPSQPSYDPRDLLTQDQVLYTWQQLKDKLAEAKAAELEYRKYVVKRAFPQAEEGTNTLELNNGYELKAVVKYHYNLVDNDVVEKTLNKIAKVGNQGASVADRLVGWTPNFLKSEYNKLKEDADSGSIEAREMLNLCHEMLIITDAAPTVDIKAPKGKK